MNSVNKSVFLTADWKLLAMANYEADPGLIKGRLPAGTEPDFFNDRFYISLVGFRFENIRLKGFRIPFHTHFPEVNLRFYVRYKENNTWKRGVVFISEIVPKPAISWVANTVYKENYQTYPMRQTYIAYGNELETGYSWKKAGHWNHIKVTAAKNPVILQEGSFEEFITEHFWGYAAGADGRTREYQVAHPRWNLLPVNRYEIKCDFGDIYGQAFSSLTDIKPVSVFLAEGSAIEVYPHRIL